MIYGHIQILILPYLCICFWSDVLKKWNKESLGHKKEIFALTLMFDLYSAQFQRQIKKEREKIRKYELTYKL